MMHSDEYKGGGVVIKNKHITNYYLIIFRFNVIVDLTLFRFNIPYFVYFL